MEQCVPFNAIILDSKDLSEIDSDIYEYFEPFNTKVGFHCHSELEGYQAVSFVSINFVDDIAVECIVSLGMPTATERYRSEYEVLKVFAKSLEILYRNGRVQEDNQEGRVFTWKQDNSIISFISYLPNGPAGAGVHLSVQVRDSRLHPHGSELEQWYSEAKKHVKNLKF